MTNYPCWLRLPWLLTEALTNHADYLGYKLLGWVISPNSILPTPSLDHSTSPGGQMHSLLPSGGSLAPGKPPCDITLWSGLSHTAAWASRDGGEPPFWLGVNVRALVEGVEELVPLVGMWAKQASLTLVSSRSSSPELGHFSKHDDSAWLMVSQRWWVRAWEAL